MRHYSKQGAKTIYIPIIGYFKIILKAINSVDAISYALEVLEQYKDTPFVVFNRLFTTECTILITNADTLKEYFLKEPNHAIKFSNPGALKFGMLMEGGPNALHRRQVLRPFFEDKNIDKIAPKILEVTRKHINRFKHENWPTEDSRSDWKQIDMGQFMKSLFSDIVDLILMKQGKLKIDGVPFSQACTTLIEMNMESKKNILNKLTLGKAQEWNLLPSTRSVKRYQNKIKDACYDIYLKKKAEGKINKDSGKDYSLLDMLIEAEKESASQGFTDIWDKEAIAGNMVLLQFAGADTSQSSMLTALFKLAGNKEVKSLFSECAEDVGLLNTSRPSKEVISSIKRHQLLENMIREVVRIYNPAPIVLNRRVIKEFSLSGYKIRKGDHFMLLTGARHFLKGSCPDRLKFDPYRFNDGSKNAPKVRTNNLPFSMGRRSCIGQYLGKMFIKIVLPSIFRDFDIRPSKGVMPVMQFKLVYVIKNCMIDIRPKKESK